MTFFFRNNTPSGDFSQLNPARILSTIDGLSQRISERFPTSGLCQVCAELRLVGGIIVEITQRLQRPVWLWRFLAAGAILILSGLFIYVMVMAVRLIPANVNGISDFLQGSESAINELIFLSIAVYFLAGMENRLKRRQVLKSLHSLRSIAHVIDMHQLTKDPAYLLEEGTQTESSPVRLMTRYELTRYLDYCSELLALTSKLAALHAQHFPDSQVLTAVNEVESLTQGLSGKIWQKIMILDISISADQHPPEIRDRAKPPRKRTK